MAYFLLVNISANTYHYGNSPVHTCNTAVKLLLFGAYCIMLFFIETWVGLAFATALLVAVAACAHLSLMRMKTPLIPVIVVAVCTIVANGFSLNLDAATMHTSGLGNVSAGIFATLEPVKIWGQCGWYPAGFAQGCYYAARIVLLMSACFVVYFTTSATALTNAASRCLRPLRVLHVPTDDIATMFGIAFRFIPVTAEELARVRNAQLSRGALLETGTVWQRLKAWKTVLFPLFVGMFRHADVLSQAMNARCYAMPNVQRTELHKDTCTLSSLCVMVLGLAAIIAIACAC